MNDDFRGKLSLVVSRTNHPELEKPLFIRFVTDVSFVG